MNTIFRLSVLILLLAGTWGCSILDRPPAGTVPDLEAARPVMVEPDPSPYYYYLESRRHSSEKQWQQAIDSIDKALVLDPDSIYLKIERITLFLKRRQMEDALTAAQELVNSHPDNVDCLEILARLTTRARSEDDTRAIYEKIIELDPEHKEAYLMLGNMYMNEADYDAAFKLFEQMKAHFPNYYVVHFYLGKILHSMGNLPAARAAFEKCIELEPGLIEPRFDLIDIYLTDMAGAAEKPEQKKIVTAYEKILELDRDNTRAMLELPLFYTKTGEKEKADAMFAELGKQVDSNHTILMTLTNDFIRKEREKDAAIIVTGLLKGNPHHGKLHYLAGMTYESIKDYQTAMTHYRQVPEDSLQHKKALVLIAFLYKDMGQLDTAVQWMETQHEKYPQDIDFITYLGFFYEQKERFEDALNVLDKGLSFSPDSTALLFRLGVVQDKAGQKEECIATMKRVIELDPKNASALNYLGYTYADLGIELDTAQSLIQRALAVKPDDGFIIDSLGWVFYKKGAFDKAVSKLEQAARLTEFDPVITEHLADAYARLKLYDKAIETYQKAISGLTEDVENKTRQINEKIDAIRQTMAE